MTNDDTPEVASAKATIQQGVTALIAAQNPDEAGVYVGGWVITAEWTSFDLERTNRGGITTANPHGQSLAMSRGLAQYGTEKHTLLATRTDES